MKMYENRFKNTRLTGIEDLDRFINVLANIEKDVNLYALGGTAMILENIKTTTRDIDFITDTHYEEMRNYLALAGYEERQKSKICNIWNFDDIRVDFFYNGEIIGVTLLDDWKTKSELLFSKARINIFRLNWEDIIITKIARLEERDIDDILDILSKVKIDFGKLKNRYKKTTEFAVGREKTFMYNFNFFEKRFKKLFPQN